MIIADWEQALRAAWADLALHPPRARSFRTRRLSSELELNAHAALRAADNAPCIVIEAEAPADAQFEVGGMRLAPSTGDGPLLVLSLEDSARGDLFTTICADALMMASGLTETDGLATFLVRLHAWRRFLREHRQGMSRNETVGLMGELVVLQHLLDENPQYLTCWAAPDDGLHDFEFLGHALEVKSTLGSVSSLSISSLDQLDTSGLRRLDILHVRMVEAPDGVSLDAMIQEAASRLPDDAARRSFDNALLRRGLMPDDTAARTTLRVFVRSLVGFRVEEGFPRIVRSLVPSAVAEARYSLELRAIESHSIDAKAVLSAFAGRGASG